MIIAGAVLFPYLPESVAIHWNLDGAADGWSNRILAVALMPAIAVALSVLFPFLMKIDPFAKKSPTLTHSWERISLIIVVFLAFAYGQQMTATLNPDLAKLSGEAIIGGLGFLFICLGAVMKDLPRNSFAGIRTPWTLKSDVTWKKTHAFASIVWIIAGLLILAASVWSAYPLTIILTAIVLAALISIAASFVYRQKKGRKK